MNDKIKYYSFNIEESTNNLNEGLDEETIADYQGSEYNSEKLNDDPMSFGDDYYDTIISLKEKYNELMQATVPVERDNNNDAQEIFEKMEQNEGTDEAERSAILEYLKYGKYNKDMINNFVNKVKTKYSNDIREFDLNEIE